MSNTVTNKIVVLDSDKYTCVYKSDAPPPPPPPEAEEKFHSLYNDNPESFYGVDAEGLMAQLEELFKELELDPSILTDNPVLQKAFSYLENNPGSALEISVGSDGALESMRIVPAADATDKEIEEANTINQELAHQLNETKTAILTPAAFQLKLNQDFTVRTTHQARTDEEARGPGENKTTTVRVGKTNDDQDSSNAWYVTTSSDSSSEPASATVDAPATVVPSTA